MDFQGSTDSLEWTLHACEAGLFVASFRYANSDTDRPQQVAVNGVVVNASQSFPTTGGWTSWNTVDVPVTLKAGANAIKLTATGSSGGNFDKMSIAQGLSSHRRSKNQCGVCLGGYGSVLAGGVWVRGLFRMK